MYCTYICVDQTCMFYDSSQTLDSAYTRANERTIDSLALKKIVVALGIRKHLNRPTSNSLLTVDNINNISCHEPSISHSQHARLYCATHREFNSLSLFARSLSVADLTKHLPRFPAALTGSLSLACPSKHVENKTKVDVTDYFMLREK
jgi:hypothetical protein